MAMTDLTKWKWKTIVLDDGEISLSIGNSTRVELVILPRVLTIDMVKGIVVIEERHLKKADEEGDLFTLKLCFASSDAISWVTSQVAERAKSPY